MTQIAVLYFSGYGHTHTLAQALISAARAIPDTEVKDVRISENGEITEQDWAALQAADGILFGAPTYMGNVPWQFKRVADASSKVWFTLSWKDKLAGGFTNSASMNGDKESTINYLKIFALQHAMVWVGLDQMPSNSMSASRNDINYLGGFSGLLAQSPSDSSPADGPLPGDLNTAKTYAERFVHSVKRWNR